MQKLALPQASFFAGGIMQLKANIYDENEMSRALMRMSHQIIEKNRGTEGIVLVGIRSRGVPLAKTIAANIKKIEDAEVPVGELDITLYRDDLTEISGDAELNSTDIAFDITGKTVILCDDVIFTGRTARAAIEAIFALGRPAAIQLAVLVDRGHRELPIRPDFVGKNIPTSLNEIVKVKVPEFDGTAGVGLYEKQ